MAGRRTARGALRRARLGRPPQHRPLARAPRPSTAPAGGCGRWAAPGSPRTSGSTTPSAATARSCARAYPVLKEASEFVPRLPGRGRAGPAGDEPVALAGERVHRRARQRGRPVRRRHDGLRDHPRALRRLPRAPPRSSARTRSSARSSQRALDRLPPYQIGRHGQLQEWLRGLRRARARPPARLAPVRPAPGPLRSRSRGTPELARAARVVARAPAGARRRRHGLEPGLDRQLLGAAGGRRPGARATCALLLARSHPAQPVRHPPAVPDRRQLRRHRRHRRDAAAEPRGRAGPAAGAAARLAGRQRRRPARPRRLRGRPRLEGRRASSARSFARSAARQCHVRYGEKDVALETTRRTGRSRRTAGCQAR